MNLRKHIRKILNELSGMSNDKTLEDVEYQMRRPGENDIVFLDVDKILDRHTNDQPEMDITKKENQIGSRVQKAKDFISNYLRDNRWINPKTGERTIIKVKFEPSVASIENGVLGFEDGRHRILATKELGLKTVAVEVPKRQVEQFKNELGTR